MSPYDEDYWTWTRDEAIFVSAYPNARRDASSETDLDLSAFPADPPFASAQVKDENWMPDAAAP
jgi:hypothetical protein